MAIAKIGTDGFNNAGTGDSSQVTLASATGDNRIAIVWVWGDFNVDPAVTENGNDITGNEFARVTLTGNQKMIGYYKTAPSTSSVEYKVTETGSYPEIHVLFYSGVDQTSPIDSSGSSTGNTTPYTQNTTVVASNCWLVGTARNYSTGNITSSDTERIAGAGHDSADSNATVGTGSQGLTWTAPSGSMGGITISIAEAGAGGGSNIKSIAGVAQASIKSVAGVANASIKSIAGVTNT